MKQINQAEWNSIIRKFCADPGEELRISLHNPFEQDGYVCATDTHVLIRVAKSYISGERRPLEKPNVAKVMPEDNPKFSVSQKTLRQAFVKLVINYDVTHVECPHCNEECEVAWSFTDNDGDTHTLYAECPCCHGSGEIPNGVNRFCVIEGYIIVAYHLILLYHLMFMLDVPETKISIGKSGQLRFNLADGVDVIIAPCNLDDKRKKGVCPVQTVKI